MKFQTENILKKEIENQLGEIPDGISTPDEMEIIVVAGKLEEILQALDEIKKFSDSTRSAVMLLLQDALNINWRKLHKKYKQSR